MACGLFPGSRRTNRSAISAVYSLLGGRDGTLWIGSAVGLQALKNDRLIDFPNARGRINTIVEDNAGTVWVARSRTRADQAGGICQVAGEQLRCFGNSDGMSLPTADPLVEDGLGNLWIGTSGELLRWSPKSWTAYFRKELKPNEGLAGVATLAVGRDHSVWVGFDNNHPGLQRIVGGLSQRAVLPGVDASKLRVEALFVDRHNSLWIGTGDDGLYRIRGNEVDHFVKEDGLTGNSVERLYEDAEENLWVVTASGLDVFRDIQVATFSTAQGLSSDHVQSVLAARDGSIWIGNSDSLDVLRGNKVTSIRRRTVCQVIGSPRFSRITRAGSGSESIALLIFMRAASFEAFPESMAGRWESSPRFQKTRIETFGSSPRRPRANEYFGSLTIESCRSSMSRRFRKRKCLLPIHAGASGWGFITEAWLVTGPVNSRL